MSEDEENQLEEWSDFADVQDKPLSPRARRFCQHLATGMKQGEAAEKVGYSLSRASIIANQPQAKVYIEQCQDKIFEMSVVERIQELGGRAVDIIEEVLFSENPEIKMHLKVETAKWLTDHIKGKAKQEVEHSGNVKLDLYAKLDALEKSGQILDVTPTKKLEGEVEGEERETTERDKLDYFLDFEADNLEE